MKYKFKWRRKNDWIWRSCRVDGHKYEEDMDKMDLLFGDDGIFSIPKWSECYLKLGQDFILSTRAEINKEAGRG